MWRDVPFACQRRPIIGVLRMCWLLPGSFDCFCCPHTSVHRPSIACLAVFLCGPGALFLHALSGPSTICPFPPHGWSAPGRTPPPCSGTTHVPENGTTVPPRRQGWAYRSDGAPRPRITSRPTQMACTPKRNAAMGRRKSQTQCSGPSILLFPPTKGAHSYDLGCGPLQECDLVTNHERLMGA